MKRITVNAEQEVAFDDASESAIGMGCSWCRRIGRPALAKVAAEFRDR